MLDEKANVIFGSRLSPELNDQIKVMSVITGVKAKFNSSPIRLSSAANSSDNRWLDAIEAL
jgi:cell division GTPase FtsZ